MTRRIGRLTPAVLFATALTFHSALADEPPFSDIPAPLLEQMIREGALEDYMKRLSQLLEQADLDGNGLSEDDLITANNVRAAQQRAQRIELLVEADLDGNGEVPRDEAIRAAIYRYRGGAPEDTQRKAYVDKAVEAVMAMDSNGDSKVTLAEGMTLPDPPKGAWRDTEHYKPLIALDSDGDGRLTIAELKDLVSKAFQEADYDHDGFLSGNEIKLLEAARQFQQKVKEASPCELPAPAADDFIAVLGIYDGALQPDITVAGQDEETKLIEIEIEPGNQPLYLVLSAFRPTIWRMRGATDRVAKAAVVRSRALGQNSQLGHAGVIGLAKDKVAFLPPQSCGYFWAEDDAKTKVAEAVIRSGAGRRLDAFLALTNAVSVALPSGKAFGEAEQRRLVVVGKSSNVSVSPGQGRQDLVVRGDTIEGLIQQEEWSGAAANLVHVDPSSVVAPGSVASYEVLPGAYGIRQLVNEGKLQRTEKGYRITQPVQRFPAELTGGHSVTFLLPEGMPMPAGDAGHSKIILEPKAVERQNGQ